MIKNMSLDLILYPHFQQVQVCTLVKVLYIIVIIVSASIICVYIYLLYSNIMPLFDIVFITVNWKQKSLVLYKGKRERERAYSHSPTQFMVTLTTIDIIYIILCQ